MVTTTEITNRTINEMVIFLSLSIECVIARIGVKHSATGTLNMHIYMYRTELSVIG